MKNLKQIFCIVMVLCLAISMIVSAGAIAPVSQDSPSPTEENSFFLELAQTPSLLELTPAKETAASSEKIELNATLKQSGYLTVEDGIHYSISAEASSLTSDSALLADLLSDYEFANSAIDDGILAIDPVTLELYSCEATADILQRIKDNDAQRQDINIVFPLLNHGCGYSYIYLNTLVLNNRITIDIYRKNLEDLAHGNPGISPGMSTTLFWVGKVQSGGEWDYKVKPGFAPYNRIFCCTYGFRDSKSNVHRTSEFFGNYNYGFTGRDIFSLSILKLGSNGAAGNPFKPDTADYPAIEEGYYDSGSY